MPRNARKELGASNFHVMVQGINRELIFNDLEYSEMYKKLLIKYKEKYRIKIFAYCIMNNHAHILIHTDTIVNMSNYMKSVNTSYGHYYNKKQNRVGFVFRDRYLSQPIYEENYLLRCIEYIHMNPVNAKIVLNKEDYKYSSYNEYLGKNLEKVTDLFSEYKPDRISQVDEEIFFIDADKKKIDVENIIKEYCKSNNKDITIIKENSDELYSLIEYLFYNKKLSKVQIASALQMHRLKIMKIIRSKEQK